MDTKSSCYLYEPKEILPILEGIYVSPLMKLKPASMPIPIPAEVDRNIELCVSDTLYCSYCVIGFIDKYQQREHYKLDWHRYNLKQHLAQKKTISEEKFSQLADDVSSISGSESESEAETDLSSTDIETVHDDVRLTNLIARRSRILFNNAHGKVVSVHRALLLNRKEEAASDEHLVQLMHKVPYRTNWLIVMIGGGHFAAGIFKGSETVLHKTFHSYTVRAKQGGTQSLKDSKGSHPKSAGSSLRRYNEQSFSQHIQELMKAWAPDIVKCDMIFYRAVGPTNSGILFNGSEPPLLKNDPRLRSIPFPTRRATFNELKRVHSLLATVFIYDSNEMFRTVHLPLVNKEPVEVENRKPKCTDGSPKGSPKKNINRAKERPSPVRELPDIVQQLAAISTSGSEGDLLLVEEEISFVDSLQEFDDTVPKHIKEQKKKPKKKKKDPVNGENNETKRELKPEVEKLWKSIHSSCLEGNDEELGELLKDTGDVTDGEISLILNQKNILGETILHNMASQAKGDILRLLMMHGADPTIKDKKSLTAYDHAPDKPTRNVFRRFMGEFPDKYDFSKSHIPNALTEELEAEIAEKKKLAKKAKRQKDKERRQAVETMKKEEYEQKCFLKLSDREKRALAAERRILAAAGKQGVVLSRCFLCGVDITGKVPFEYDSNRFCTMDCLKKHRSNLKKDSS